jgi:hypothetical protein
MAEGTEEDSRFVPELTEEQEKQSRRVETTPLPVIHEVIRRRGKDELARSNAALAWSGLAAGMTMGFSLISEGLFRAHLPQTEWAPLVSKIGYSVGFIMERLLPAFHAAGTSGQHYRGRFAGGADQPCATGGRENAGKPGRIAGTGREEENGEKREGKKKSTRKTPMRWGLRDLGAGCKFRAPDAPYWPDARPLACSPWDGSHRRRHQRGRESLMEILPINDCRPRLSQSMEPFLTSIN